MALELITGHKGTDHITSQQVGSFNAYTYGEQTYILRGLTASLNSARTEVNVNVGQLLVEGRHVANNATQTLPLTNCGVGMNRITYVIAYYEKGTTETIELQTKDGDETTGTPQPPVCSGSILNGDNSAEIPLYSIKYENGFPTSTTPTNVTSGKKWKHPLLDLVYPIGAVFISYNSTSPATLMGGTWTRIKNVMIRANNVDSGTPTTGGSDTRVLTTSNMPSHTHTFTTGSSGSHNHGNTSLEGEHGHTSFTIMSQSGYSGEHSHSGTAKSAGAHTHRAKHLSSFSGSKYGWVGDRGTWSTVETGSAGSHTHPVEIKNSGDHYHDIQVERAGNHRHSINNAGGHTHTGTTATRGSGTAFDNKPKYIDLYVWRRTA